MQTRGFAGVSTLACRLWWRALRQGLAMRCTSGPVNSHYSMTSELTPLYNQRTRTTLQPENSQHSTTNKLTPHLLNLEGASCRGKGGVFTSGVWPLLSNLEDPELRRLAQALPATMLSSRADSTTKNARASSGAVHAAPKAAVEEAVHALSWLHGLAGLQPLGGSTLVKANLEGLRRILAKPKVRKEPVTADMLKAMVEAAGLAPSLTVVRLLAVYLVAFAGFRRCDELIRLRCEDITFSAEGMIIIIVSSKTDQYREGSSLVIARTGGLTCPVGMMEKYFQMGELNHTPKACVFQGISVIKEGEWLKKTGDTRLRELLLQKITQLGYEPKAFGMHSLHHLQTQTENMNEPKVDPMTSLHLEDVYRSPWRFIELTHVSHLAPSLFNNYANALHWIMANNYGAQLLHYLDDFLLVGPPGKDTCQEAMYRMLLVCDQLGIPVASEKLALRAPC
eukprot:Em0002g1417a